MFAARPVTSDQCTTSRPEGGRGRAHEQEVASSCTRSSLLAQPCGYGALAQLGERRLCKPEVTGSIPVRSIDSTSWLRAPQVRGARGPWLLTFVLDLRQLLQAPWPNGSRGVLRLLSDSHADPDVAKPSGARASLCQSVRGGPHEESAELAIVQPVCRLADLAVSVHDIRGCPGVDPCRRPRL